MSLLLSTILIKRVCQKRARNAHVYIVHTLSCHGEFHKSMRLIGYVSRNKLEHQSVHTNASH